MRESTLEKFSNKAKNWISPKHPLYGESKEFKKNYGAAVFVQAGLNEKVNALGNFELQRLLTRGFGLSKNDISQVIHIARNQGVMTEYLIEHLKTREKKSIFLMDLMYVAMRREPMSENELAAISLFGTVLEMDKEDVSELFIFIRHAYEEDEKACKEDIINLQKRNIQLGMMQLKYYLPKMDYISMPDNILMNQSKKLHIMDRCEIRDCIEVGKNMECIIDSCTLRLFGQIVVNGGRLIIRNSRIVKKSDEYKTCIHIKQPSEVVIEHTKVDCRNAGTFLVQDNGELEMEGCQVINTTKGAAVQFFGQNISMESCQFASCYSPDDGGAVLIRGGNGHIQNCTFKECEAKRGAGIFCSENLMILGCHFVSCRCERFGAAIYYNGEMKSKVQQIYCEKCCPKETDIIQYIGGRGEYVVKKETSFRCSTIIDKPVRIEELGVLTIENSAVILNYPILCSGVLNVKYSRLLAHHLKEQDMIVATRAKGITIYKSEFDGACKSSGISGTRTRLHISRAVFMNMVGGRAVYNAYAPEIIETVFNFCQSGAVHCRAGSIHRCMFINCRAKSGAGIMMLGNRGEIGESTFRRCVSERSGGAIDKTGSHSIKKCIYEDCKPDNVS